MLHTLIGPENFRAGSDLYFDRHDGQAATCDDFVAAMADASGIDLAQFQRWYEQAGTPVLSVAEAFDDGCLTLTIEQRCPPTPGQTDKPPLHVPVRLGLIGADGAELTAADLPVETDGDAVAFRAGAGETPDSLLLHLRARTTTVRFPGHAERPHVSMLRGFSAPVRLDYPRAADELGFLAIHDRDGFARWDALQTLVVDEVGRLMDGGGVPAGQLLELFGELLEQARAAAEPEARFMLAKMLTLPDETYLMQQFDPVDVGALCDARDALRLVADHAEA